VKGFAVDKNRVFNHGWPFATGVIEGVDHFVSLVENKVLFDHNIEQRIQDI
jgi:hypothetical protein